MRTNETQAGHGEAAGFFRRVARCAFARSPVGGKKTSEIKFRCADELKAELARKAHALGFRSESELSELVMALAIFGFEHVATVQRERLEKVAKLFPNGAVKVAGAGKESLQ